MKPGCPASLIAVLISTAVAGCDGGAAPSTAEVTRQFNEARIRTQDGRVHDVTCRTREDQWVCTGKTSTATVSCTVSLTEAERINGTYCSSSPGDQSSAPPKPEAPDDSITVSLPATEAAP